MLQGLTAHCLTESDYPATRGETALVLSAAGGLGQHLVRLLSRRGARVIGTVSAPGKAAAAEAVGARHVIVRGADPDELTRRVLDLTGGRGVDVVYDGIGKDTFEAGLAALRPRGTSSWSVPPPGPCHRSTRVPRAPRLALPHRPTPVDHATDPEELTARANSSSSRGTEPPAGRPESDGDGDAPMTRFARIAYTASVRGVQERNGSAHAMPAGHTSSTAGARPAFSTSWTNTRSGSSSSWTTPAGPG
ncbi:zinc-binding dehydrogenase [Streptomyces griseofuscus]|uniref:zinc-binding dehydrogenase n=1 Tax=Streptomyces griseofuscus TaxID=146922 RepID=UPI0034531059